MLYNKNKYFSSYILMDYTYKLKPKKTQKLYKNVKDEDKFLFEDYSPPIKNIKYDSFFFRSDILTDYTKQINTIFTKNGKQSLFKQNYKLYNMDDIVYYLLSRPGVRTRNYNKIIKSVEWQEIKKYIIALIPTVLAKICTQNVSSKYIIGTFNKNIKKLISDEISNIYNDDIVILAPREIENYISYEKIKLNHRSDSDSSSSNSDSSSSDSDSSDSDMSEEEDYILKRIQEINEELDEDIEEELKESDEVFQDPEEIIEKMNDYEDLEFANYREQFKEKLKMIVGFMIVSREKCKIYPNDYILNLICANMPGVGSILLGLYLYTILKHPIVPITTNNLLEDLELSGEGMIYYDKIKKSKTFKKKYKNESKYGINVFKRKFMTNDDLIPTNGIAILELANSYFNYPGLCSYEKFGFEYDNNLFSNSQDTKCMYEHGNLPMIIKFGDNTTSGCYNGLTINEKIKKILNIVVGNEQCSRNKLCIIKNDKYKKLLSNLNSLILYQDLHMKLKKSNNYEIIKSRIMTDELKENLSDILDIVDRIKPSDEINYDYIKRIIYYIENDNITPDVQILLNYFVGGFKKNTKKNKNISKKNKNISKKNKFIS